MKSSTSSEPAGWGRCTGPQDTRLSRQVAVKVITAKATQSQRAIDRFEREAKTVAQLSHPNILDIHDFGRDDGVVYAVTELLEGEDLRDRMRGSMLPTSKALEIGAGSPTGSPRHTAKESSTAISNRRISL